MLVVLACSREVQFLLNVLIKLHRVLVFYDDVLEDWFLVHERINETTPRTILVGGQLGLDTIFNPGVETQNLLSERGSGIYRVYACFRDPDGDVLVCDDESLMEDTYEFTVTDT